MSPVYIICNVPLSLFIICLVVWAVVLITWKGRKS